MIRRAFEVDETLRPPSLACHAKSFQHPALSALWKAQDLPVEIVRDPPELRSCFTSFKRLLCWLAHMMHSNSFQGRVGKFSSSATSRGLMCLRLWRLTWTSLYRWEHVKRFLSTSLVSVTFRKEGEGRPDTNTALASTIFPLPAYLEELDLSALSRSASIRSTLRSRPTAKFSL